jgi:hypothetical protein
VTVAYGKALRGINKQSALAWNQQAKCTVVCRRAEDPQAVSSTVTRKPPGVAARALNSKNDAPTATDSQPGVVPTNPPGGKLAFTAGLLIFMFVKREFSWGGY